MRISSKTNRAYGWKKDLPDFRDHQFSLDRSIDPASLPTDVSLLGLPPVFDQGNLGSCVFNAVVNAYHYMEMNQRAESRYTLLSRLFAYYNGRVLQNTVSYDSGSSIRDGIKSVAKFGVCKEELWSYAEKDFIEKPDPECYADGLNHQAITYSAVRHDPLYIKSCLANGFPIVFGFTVFDSFEDYYISKSGMMPMPKYGERKLGGHGVLLCGYNDETEYGWIMNSWGANWGADGFFFMPYKFLFDPKHCSDFWTIKSVEI